MARRRSALGTGSVIWSRRPRTGRWRTEQRDEDGEIGIRAAAWSCRAVDASRSHSPYR